MRRTVSVELAVARFFFGDGIRHWRHVVVGLLRIEGDAVQRGAKVRLIRDNVVIHEGTLSTLKRFKDEVKEVPVGQECGMAFENHQDIRAGDVIECFRVEKVQRTLD